MYEEAATTKFCSQRTERKKTVPSIKSFLFTAKDVRS